jgi:tRNA dimethylallyltransferase
MQTKLPQIICVVGPTASGKSDLAVEIAKAMNGSILSCDSRQIYRGFDISSGKVKKDVYHNNDEDKTKPNFKSTPKNDDRTHSEYYHKEVLHYGLDVAHPNKPWTAAQFKQYGQLAIEEILHNKKTPVLCGGTGHWIDSLVFNQAFPQAPPDFTLRNSLEQKTTEELFAKLTTLDPRRAESIDRHNKRRLIRALEIVQTTGQRVPELTQTSAYESLWLGIDIDKEKLRGNIHKRLIERVEHGMVDEIQDLQKHGLSYEELESYGLEYKFTALLLQKKLSMEEYLGLLETAIWQYSRRQMTWFKKNKDIHWVKSVDEALHLTQEFTHNKPA